MLRALLALLLLTFPARAAIAVVQQVAANNNSNATTLAAPTITTSAGNALLVAVTQDDIRTVTIANTGGDTFNAISACNVGNNNRTQWFWAAGIAGNASDIITVTWNTANPNRGVIVYEVSGLDTSPFDQGPACNNGVLNGSATVTSASFTTTSANEIMLLAVRSGFASGRAFTAQSGFTLGTTPSLNYIGSEYKIVSSIQSSITISIDVAMAGFEEWSVSAVTFKAPSSPSGFTSYITIN